MPELEVPGPSDDAAEVGAAIDGKGSSSGAAGSGSAKDALICGMCGGQSKGPAAKPWANHGRLPRGTRVLLGNGCFDCFELRETRCLFLFFRSY